MGAESLYMGRNWTRSFITKLLHVTLSQCIYRNFTLHDAQSRYKWTQECEELLCEVDRLSQLDPNDIPASSRFLLKVDFNTLDTIETDCLHYWVQTIHAAETAGLCPAYLQIKQSHQQPRAIQPPSQSWSPSVSELGCPDSMEGKQLHPPLLDLPYWTYPLLLWSPAFMYILPSKRKKLDWRQVCLGWHGKGYMVTWLVSGCMPMRVIPVTPGDLVALCWQWKFWGTAP